MPNKFLSIASAALVTFNVLAAEPVISPFDNEYLGKCYPDTDAFMHEAMGEWAFTDPNIARLKKGAWTWIVDRTASENYTWYLFEAKNTDSCLRVFVPAASTVKFKRWRGGRIYVEAIVSEEADFPAKAIEFRYNASSHFFRPANCFVLKNLGGAKIIKRQSVSCDHIFD